MGLVFVRVPCSLISDVSSDDVVMCAAFFFCCCRSLYRLLPVRQTLQRGMQFRAETERQDLLDNARNAPLLLRIHVGVQQQRAAEKAAPATTRISRYWGGRKSAESYLDNAPSVERVEALTVQVIWR